MGAWFRPASAPTLDALGVIDELRDAGRVFGTTPEAIAAARRTLHHTGVLTAGDPREDSRMESAR